MQQELTEVETHDEAVMQTAILATTARTHITSTGVRPRSCIEVPPILKEDLREIVGGREAVGRWSMSQGLPVLNHIHRARSGHLAVARVVGAKKVATSQGGCRHLLAMVLRHHYRLYQAIYPATTLAVVTTLLGRDTLCRQ